jgi:hypothetical protein
MKVREMLKIWLATKLGLDQISLPTDGRSSIEKTGLTYGLENYTSRFTGISPIISFEMLKTLKHLWLYHPEFAQHVSNLVSLANTGHQISIPAENSQKAEIAIQRLNETAMRIYQHGAGVDGLINQELTSVAWSGAISSEDVVNLTARRVEKVVIVPVEDIRFDWIENQWTPFQYVGIARGNSKTGLIPLHPETYRYYAVETIDNSPYAKPPATAAVEAITNLQNEVVENVKYIVNKFSILGLLSVMVRRLSKQGNETEAEYNSRSQKYLKEVRDSLSGSFNKGLLVAYDNMQFKGENVAANGQGFYDVYRMISETMMSGLRQQPAFFGHTDSTTETYADVVYQLLIAQAHNYQRIVKRRRERTYIFDLRLAGIDVSGVSLKFNKAFSRNLLAEAQARDVEIRNAITKAREGIISADQAAQELGYESAYDPSILEESSTLAQALQVLHEGFAGKAKREFTFQFDKQTGKYKFVQTVIQIDTKKEFANIGNVVEIKKKTQLQRVSN